MTGQEMLKKLESMEDLTKEVIIYNYTNRDSTLFNPLKPSKIDEFGDCIKISICY